MTMMTSWGEALDPSAPLPEYPRPQLERDRWQNLNGPWQYAITPLAADAAADPLAVADPADPPAAWDGSIIVPFSPETVLSTVQRMLVPGQTLWYRRSWRLTHQPVGDERVLLHLGAVDQSCRIAVDGVEVGAAGAGGAPAAHVGHTGGYLPITVDVTDALAPGEQHEIVVAVRDVTDTSWLARGKQSRGRGGIWYTPQSGIWQTVWTETVPRIAVDAVCLTPQLGSAVVGAVDGAVGAGAGADSGVGDSAVVVEIDSTGADTAATASLTIRADGETVAIADVPVGVPTRVDLGPVRPWSPEDPFLYDVDIALGEDRVRSYVGMRSLGVGHDERGNPRLLLNGRPYLPVGLLDQGYWPDGGYTAPSDQALQSDILLAKRLGYTMLRKHIKVEPLRWYHHCDRIGMLVWQDAVNGGTTYRPRVIMAPALGAPSTRDDRYAAFGRASARGRERFEAELKELIDHLRGVTSIVLWVPFNEGWGQFDAARIAELVRRWDATRPVDHASGWHDQGAGDLQSRHVYFRAVRVPRRRDDRVLALTEYGGYSLAVPGRTWGSHRFGYRRYRTRERLQAAFERLHEREIIPAVQAGLAALVYTQLTDVEDEDNGLVTYDRRFVKVDEAAVRRMNDRLRAAARDDAAREDAARDDAAREDDPAWMRES